MQLNSKQIRALLQRDKGGLKASIYMPTSPKSTTESIEQDRTRLKNALQDIQNNHAYSKEELDDPIRQVTTELYENNEFWKFQNLGLAIFIDSNGFTYMHLPFEIEEATHISDRFILSPLLIIESADRSFYLLDVNLTQPRLYFASRGKLELVNQENTPGSFEDEIGVDEYQRQLQHQSTGSTGFHGHEDDGTMEKDIRSYLKKIANSADTYLDSEDKPLLLGGTPNRVGNLRSQLKYKHVPDEVLEGNHEETTSQKLYIRSREIIDKTQRADNDAAVEKLAQAKREFVVTGSKNIEDAAEAGRVATLYLPAYRLTADSVQSGMNQKLLLQLPADLEEIETITTKVLAQGGDITAVESDTYKDLDKPKALCRY